MQQVVIWGHRAVGAAIGILIMGTLARLSGEQLAQVPFVTSIMLVMALPDSDAASPRCVFFGHLGSAVAGLTALGMVGPGDYGSALAIGMALFVMIATRTVHPPAGMDAYLIALNGLPAVWVLSPVLTGAAILVVYSQIWQWLEKQLVAWVNKVNSPGNP